MASANGGLSKMPSAMTEAEHAAWNECIRKHIDRIADAVQRYQDELALAQAQYEADMFAEGLWEYDSPPASATAGGAAS